MKRFIEFEVSKETPKLSPNWKVFWIAFVAIFIVMSLNLLGVKAPALISPVLSEELEKEKVINEKLHKKSNSYKLEESSQNFSLAQEVYAAEGEYFQSSGFAVVDFETGKVLKEHNLHDKTSIASLTKIMTAVVALDLAHSSDVFTVTRRASRIIPTKIGVTPGEKMTVNELLHAVLLTSANDAAEVVREGIDEKYGKGSFIKGMNEKAEFLGLENTSFSNPQGFDNPNNYSTPADLTVLTHYALTQYPLIAEISKKDYLFLEEDNNHSEFDLYNWNGLLGVYPNIEGVKIGNTGDAGKTTIVISERNNKKILVVLLGAPGLFERDLWAAELLNIGFSETLGLEPIVITTSDLQAKYDSWQNGS